MRATRAIIRLDHLEHNIGQIIRASVGVPGNPDAGVSSPRICLAVKADAYGHGIVRIGRKAAEIGVDALAVATVDEGLELREAGVSLPILLYSLPIPEEIASVVKASITPLLGDREMIDLFEEECRVSDAVLPVHLKVDTGMGRIGCRPEEAPELVARIAGSGHLRLGGVSTHFAASDWEDTSYTESQRTTFDNVLDTIRAAGIDTGTVHAANSGAVIGSPDTLFSMIRPGIAAYGYYPSREQARGLDLKPVMELRSKVVFIKQVPKGTAISYGMKWRAPVDTYIGTIPVGYGDGYNRLLTNKAHVLIGENRYPVVGTVCMDQTMIDLGPTCRVPRFDDVVLFGYTPGAPTAEKIATICGTIPYETTCMISSRVPRIAVASDEEARKA